MIPGDDAGLPLVKVEHDDSDRCVLRLAVTKPHAAGQAKVVGRNRIRAECRRRQVGSRQFSGRMKEFLAPECFHVFAVKRHAPAPPFADLGVINEATVKGDEHSIAGFLVVEQAARSYFPSQITDLRSVGT